MTSIAPEPKTPARRSESGVVRRALVGASGFAIVFLCLSRQLTSGECETIDLVATSNRDLLQSFSCDFTVSLVSGDRDKILSGEARPTRVRRGQWHMRAGDILYTLDCGEDSEPVRVRGLKPADFPKLQDTGKRAKVLPVDCRPTYQLVSRNKSVRVSYSPGLGAANLHAGGQFTAVFTPFSMGAMGNGDEFSPHTFITGAARGTHSVSYLGNDVIDGREVDVIEGRVREGTLAQGSWRWYIDVHRGATPVRIELFDGRGTLRADAHALQVEQLSNGAWIIKRSILLSERLGKAKATLIEVEDFSLEPPSSKLFKLPIEAGDHVINVSDMRSSVIATSEDVLNLESLDDWLERCEGRRVVRVERQELDDRLRGLSPDRSMRYMWLLGVVVVGVVVGCIIILIGRR